MNNKGNVTIFCCLVMIALIVLGVNGIKAVEYHLAKSKCAMTVKSAMSGVDAGYNSYIYENYHILLFDKYCNGRGEAYLEEQLLQDIEANLGIEFVVEDVVVEKYSLLIDDNLKAFREQMEDYGVYAFVENGANYILDSTGNKDGTVADYIYQDMEDAKKSKSEDVESGGKLGFAEDPRDYTKTLDSDGILAIVTPEDLEVSATKVALGGVLSMEKGLISLGDFSIENDFEDIDVFKDDIDEYDSWKDIVSSAGTGVLYAGKVFNCATETVQENTVFDFELEYIICGKDSDRDNLKGVVNRIIGIRLPVNFSYLISDASKMAEISKISLPISLVTLVPEPVVRYLIAGCWSYVESIFDVKCLLDGQKLEFFKTKQSWKTDLYNLEKSVNMSNETNSADSTGLSYKDYLTILLALDIEDGYYRMLDIIELNTRQYYKSFDMNHAAVGFWLDAQIKFRDKFYYINESIGY